MSIPAISKITVNERGIIQRAPVKGGNRDMVLVRTAIMIPRWLKRWVDRQPEKIGLLFERGCVEYFGADPPDSVKKCLGEQKRSAEETARARERALACRAAMDRFRQP